jgi:DNA helicase HerA-like ATPase
MKSFLRFSTKWECLYQANPLDEQKILIANLSKGELGEDASTIIGSILVTSIQLSALYRAKQPIEKRTPFYLYVDEAHSFLSLSFADILAESRKYGLALFLAHQYIDQLQEDVRTAVFGNVGTLICFRVGATDAEILEKEFEPEFNKSDLIKLPKFDTCIKLMINGVTSQPFSSSNELH